MQNPCVTEPELAPPGCSSLYVLVPVTHEHPNVDWRREAAGFRRLTLRQLERLGVRDIEKRIRFEKTLTPAGWAQDMNIFRGATFNLKHDLGQMLHLRPRNRFEDLDHSPWQPVSDHYITRGIPWRRFPWDNMAVPRSSASGQVLIRTANGNPVLAVQTVGRGRLAAFAYAEKGMIPEIHNVFETGLHYPYHEYLWSLLARAVVWAAKREPPAAIRDVVCTASNVPCPAKTSIPPSPIMWLCLPHKNCGGRAKRFHHRMKRLRPSPHQGRPVAACADGKP